MAGYLKQQNVTSASLAQCCIKTNHSQDNIQRVKTFVFKTKLTIGLVSESAYLLEGVCVESVCKERIVIISHV